MLATLAPGVKKWSSLFRPLPGEDMLRPSLAWAPMRRRRSPILLCGLLVASGIGVGPELAQAQAGRPGISARFVPLAATIGEELRVRLEVDDPTETIQSATLELLRDEREDWLRRPALRRPGPGVTSSWEGTFTSTTVWNPGGLGVRQPERLLLRARLYGRRGGLILTLGELDPLEVDVLTPKESEARARVLTAEAPEEGGLTLVGYAGADARAGSSARIRGVIGVGGDLSPHLELLFFVLVGPKGAPPSRLEEGGPLVLGFEGSLRTFTRPPGRGLWTLFLEPFLGADLRFPGFDPGAGLRAGLQYPLGRLVELEVAVGGAIYLYSVGGADPFVGASGGLRLGLRFGGEREAPTEAPR